MLRNFLTWWGHFASPIMLSERPKSSLTDESPLLLGSVEDSDEVFPRYSQRDMRAKPCWGRLLVA